LIFQAKPERHIVLTVSTRTYKSPGEALDKMKDSIRRWANLIRTGNPDRDGRPRFTPRKFEYALVWDCHESGYPHAHLATWGDYLPLDEIKALWTALTGATVIWIESMQEGTDHYHNWVKYLREKPLENPLTGSHPRRVTFSRGYHRTVDHPDLVDTRAKAHWIWVPAHPYMLIAWLTRRQKGIILDNEDANSWTLTIECERIDEPGWNLKERCESWFYALPREQRNAIWHGDYDHTTNQDADDPDEPLTQASKAAQQAALPATYAAWGITPEQAEQSQQPLA
jgi:hypothetical protein